ncbi:MAG: pyridoxal-phosphate dependent enzyme [Gammaproteobacteria bacterium]|nr:pyridoxal-phosphate dependent enzyme [Gammaproteobacteria bacterium]
MPSPVELLSSQLLTEKDIRLYVKRDDLIHPALSGNKWRKLKYNLLQARQNQQKVLLTFGGAYSNHIYAVAAAGKLFNFNTVGIIRGERPLELGSTLKFAESQGMYLHFISREDYRKKTNAVFLEGLKKSFGSFYNIPEGGTNQLALKGVQEVISELDVQIPENKIICTACGTGGTAAGLIKHILQDRKDDLDSDTKDKTNCKNQVIGFPALKNASWMYEDINRLLYGNISTGAADKWSLKLDYHFGGYAKYTQELISFIADFKNEFNIQLEQVYTAKMFYGLFDLIKQDYFTAGTNIVAIHTGGLQGLLKELKAD